MKTGTGLKTTGSAVAVLAFVMLTVGVCSAGAAAPRSQRDDVRSLSKQVHRELMTLPWYGVFDDLEYRINGSEVMLTGQVVRPITKSDAEASVKKLEGVTRVVNNITCYHCQSSTIKSGGRSSARSFPTLRSADTLWARCRASTSSWTTGMYCLMAL
jgi:BON domain